MRGVRVWSPAVVAALLLAALPVVSSQAARGVPQDGAAPAAARAVDDIVLRVAMQDDVKSLNPLVAGDVWTWNVLGYIYDTPMSTDLIDSSKFIPYIATHSSNCSASSLFNYDNRSEWEPLAKYGQITVHYDFTNVFFHDGHQMDIGDILFSFGVQATVTDWASSVKCLMDKGGDIGSNYSDTHWLAIKTMDSTTLRFYFQAPFADFIRNTLSVFILPQHIWANKAGGQSVDGTDPFLPPTNSYAWNPAKAIDYTNNPPVGSGPFKFVSWTPGQQAKIDTWREHFFPHQPFIDAIVFKIYKTAEQAVQALQMGDIDYIAWSIPPTYVPDLERDENIGLAMNAEKGFFYMGFNMRKKSFGYLDNDPEKGDYGKTFRQAVAHCVNKKEIVERILQNFGIPAVGPISEMDSEWYNESLEDYEFDPQKALDILAAGADGNPNTTADNYKLTNPSVDPGKGNWWLNPDGTPIGSGEGGRLEILTPPADYDPIHCQAPSMIATQMQSIGINAESVTLDFGTIVNRIDQRNFDMYLLGWRIGSDPSDFMHAFFHSSAAESGQNYPGYRNESYDALIDLARSTSDEYLLHKAIDDAGSHRPRPALQRSIFPHEHRSLPLRPLCQLDLRPLRLDILMALNHGHPPSEPVQPEGIPLRRIPSPFRIRDRRRRDREGPGRAPGAGGARLPQVRQRNVRERAHGVQFDNPCERPGQGEVEGAVRSRFGERHEGRNPAPHRHKGHRRSDRVRPGAVEGRGHQGHAGGRGLPPDEDRGGDRGHRRWGIHADNGHCQRPRWQPSRGCND